MKIGTVAKRANLSTSTIRYYINQGLLFPKKVNNQYYFTEKDIQLFSLINMWKDMGFSLKEIAHLSALEQASNWIEIENFTYYYEIIKRRQSELRLERQEIERKLELIETELQCLQNNEFHQWEHGKHKAVGFPICCLNLLVCPECGRPLQLKNAEIDYRYIYSGTLHCGCGYHAVIDHGTIRCGQFSDAVTEQPDLLFDKNKRLSNELSTILQRASNWILSYISRSATKPQVILETRLNSYFFLYPHFKLLNSNDTVIIADRFPEVISIYKQYIERLDLNTNIIFIVNEDNHLPIKKGTVDTFIDFHSTNNFNLFERSNYLSLYADYLQDKGQIVGAYFSLDHAVRSFQALFSAFPDCHPDNYKISFLKKSLSGHYELEKLEEIGVTTDVGGSSMFPFLCIGENLRAYCYAARKRNVVKNN